MKNILKSLVLLSALAITTTNFAQTKAPNYNQQNQLSGLKQTSTVPGKVQLNNHYSTNHQVNH